MQCILPLSPPHSRSVRWGSFVQDSKIQFVVDAVYAFAHALHQLREDVCGADMAVGMCQLMADYNGKEFYQNYLLNVSFVGEYTSSGGFGIDKFK